MIFSDTSVAKAALVAVGIKVDESDGCHWHIVARGQSGESGDILELCQDVWWTDIINLATWHLKAPTGQSGESGDI